MQRSAWRGLAAAALLGLATACVSASNPYVDASAAETARFKLVAVPLPSGTSFLLSQGPFGANTHHDPGESYKWDLDVPFGTPVVAVQAGTVLSVWEASTGGGCDPRFNESPHNVKVLHADGTVAQYAHVASRVRPGDVVARGQVIAVTALNGFLCEPQLCFSVYASREEMHGTSAPRNLPLRFAGIDGELLREGTRYTAP